MKRALKISRDSASGKTFFQKIRARVDEGNLANSSRADFRFNPTRASAYAPWAGRRGSGERKLGRVTFIILNIILDEHNNKFPFLYDEAGIYQSESGIQRTG